MPQETLKKIQDKLAQIQTTASGLPAGTDVSGASESLGRITQQVRDIKPIPIDEAEATPPMFEPSPPPEDLSLKEQVEKQRKLLEETNKAELERVNKQLEEARKKEAEYLANQKEVLGQAEPLTQPFRQNIETAERERLKIEENFFANQALTNELDQLLTESMEMTRKLQTQKVPGLAGIQQSTRMIKAQENVQGRIAVIEAVMSARNNQIGTAQGFIDRTLNNIQADRNDRLNYLDTLFNFYESAKNEAGQKIFDLTKEQKEVFARQRQLIEEDLKRSEAVADRVKSLIAENPLMASEAGISLSDTEEEINNKLAEWQYSSEVRSIRNEASEKGLRELQPTEIRNYPLQRIFTVEDSRGRKINFLTPPDWETVQFDNDLYRVDPNTGKKELLIAGTKPTQTQTEITRELREQIISAAEPILTQSEGENGFVNPDTYLNLRQQYFMEFGNTSGFDQIFSHRLSPQERERLGIGRIGVPGTSPSDNTDNTEEPMTDEEFMKFLRTGEIDG